MIISERKKDYVQKKKFKRNNKKVKEVKKQKDRIK